MKILYYLLIITACLNKTPDLKTRAQNVNIGGKVMNHVDQDTMALNPLNTSVASSKAINEAIKDTAKVVRNIIADTGTNIWARTLAKMYLQNITGSMVTSALGYTPISTESDPIYSASAASGISATNITNWNNAFSWGNPAGVYQPINTYPNTTDTSHWNTVYRASSSYATTANLSTKVAYTDTSGMLSPYLHKTDTTGKWLPIGTSIPSVTGKVNYTDTAGMLSPYLHKSDTAGMLVPYLRKNDTSSLSSRIDAKGTVTKDSAGYGLLGGNVTTSGYKAVDTSVLATRVRVQKAVDSLNVIIGTKQPQISGTGFVKSSGTTISYDNSTYYLNSNPSGYTTNTGTVTSVTAGTGLSGGTISITGTISMPNVGTAGTYGSGSAIPVITFDAQGRGSAVTTVNVTPYQPTIHSGVTRALNSAFTLTGPSAGICVYSYSVQIQVTLLGAGTITPQYSTDGGSTWVVCPTIVSPNLLATTVQQVSGTCPANAMFKIATSSTGTVTFTYMSGQETY